MALAVDARAVAELAVVVLLQHLGDAAVGEDVARVDEAVQHLGRLLDQVRLVRVLLVIVCPGRGGGACQVVPTRPTVLNRCDFWIAPETQRLPVSLLSECPIK